MLNYSLPLLGFLIRDCENNNLKLNIYNKVIECQMVGGESVGYLKSVADGSELWITGVLTI